jgi:MATE family multidrug resistance protein
MTQANRLYKSYHRPGGVKELLVLALPMIISMACDGIMIFTDRLFLSKVDPVQMNAALDGGITFEVLIFFFIGLTGYSNALVAQYFGAGEKDKSSKTIFQAFLIIVAAYPLIILLKPLVLGYFDWMHIPKVQVGYQIVFIDILSWFCLVGLTRHVLACYFSGIGHTKVVMNATLVALFVNVVLDYILIFGKLGVEPMGIKGAGIATVSGEAAAMLMLLWAYLQKENRIEFSVMKSFRFDKAVMKNLLYYGSPAGLEMLLNFMAFSMMVSLFHAQGETVATASTIMFNWDMLSFIPLIGIEIGVTSLVGRYMGANKTKLAENAAYSAIKVGLAFSLCTMTVFIFLPHLLVQVFHPDSNAALFLAAAPLAESLLRIAAFYVLTEAIMIALIGTLRGAGDTYFTMFASIGLHWLFVPILYLSLNVFEFSVPSSWLFIALFYFVFTIVFFWRFKSGKWKKIKVVG